MWWLIQNQMSKNLMMRKKKEKHQEMKNWQTH